ncbi:7TM-DISM domain-containing protein [Marivirga salinae]|uniref:histidine kinase n=1 Tax=Marivirga salinarum TaxID=3059078 RepID=A0AA51RCH0_9BACT|nr:7TM-DISM domain-containing protein [Marivirga sp. BDSF4-3]WMN11703.1 7TM-DISM domain-containing protein [Marivirga sp. BDSF4-3]
MLIIFLLIPNMLFCANPINVNQLEDIFKVSGNFQTYSDLTDSAEINDVINFDWKGGEAANLNFGIAEHPQWIKFNIQNASDQFIEKFLYIPYHHIEYIDLYVVNTGKVIRQIKTGTARPYDEKVIESSGYPFKLNLQPNSTYQLYLRLDHRYLPLRANLFLLSESKMREVNNDYHSLKWFWKGIMLFSIILSSILFFFIKTRLFLYYTLLLIGIILFVGVETGDYFLFINQDNRNTIIDIKHLGNILVVYSFPMFLNALTPIKKLNPKMWKFMIYLVFGFCILFILVLFDPIKDTKILLIITYYAIYVSALIFVFQLVFLFRAALLKKPNAILLLAIYTFYVTVFWLTNTFPNLGVIQSESINVYAILLVMSIIEIFTFLFLVARENYKIYNERTSLVRAQKLHQRNLLLATVESQEKERNLVGRELHDMIGANLAVVKQQIAKDNQYLRNLLQQTVDAVRNLSHGLITPQLKNKDLKYEITELCVLSSNDKISFSSYFYGWEHYNPSSEVTLHIFRIVQELIQNAIKHSKANNVRFQFFCSKEGIMIQYIDDGIGFQLKEAEKGIGLLNIHNRIKLINGELILHDGSHEKGVLIQIVIK